MTDPREAKTLGEAARNPDGTYNALKALSWLSEAINPGKGLPETEVRKIADEVVAKRAAMAGKSCVNHPARPARDVLDDEALCQECCDAWVRSEGHAAAERERDEP